MRLNFTKSIVVLATIFCLLPTSKSSAQDFIEIFLAPEKDVTEYLGNYIEPAMFSFANGMVGGWYNTAKTHKPLGFDLTFTLNIANIPESQRQFDFTPSNNLRLATATGSGQLPTIVGGDTNESLQLTGSFTAPDGNTYRYNGNTFAAPNGFDVSSLPVAGIPVPMAQLGIGLIKNTDLKIRYGKFSAEDSGLTYGVNQFGIGVMHDFKQWIPGIKHIPVDMAVFVGFSRFKSTVDFNENEPTVFSAVGTTEMVANNTTIQALVSKKLSVLTVYGGLGYNIVSSSLKVKGDIVNYSLTNPLNGEPYRVSDPVDFTFDGGSTFRGTIGMRLKFAFLTLHTDYTFQKYNMLTAGVGISIR